MIVIHQTNVAGFAGNHIYYGQLSPVDTDRVSGASGGAPAVGNANPLSLTQTGNGNGFSEFRYDTVDSHGIVDTSGYFNNNDDNVDLNVGDTVIVVVWDGAVRTGTLISYGKHIVNQVNATTGEVDLTNVTSFNLSDTD